MPSPFAHGLSCSVITLISLLLLLIAGLCKLIALELVTASSDERLRPFQRRRVLLYSAGARSLTRLRSPLNRPALYTNVLCCCNELLFVGKNKHATTSRVFYCFLARALYSMAKKKKDRNCCNSLSPYAISRERSSDLLPVQRVVCALTSCVHHA